MKRTFLVALAGLAMVGALFSLSGPAAAATSSGAAPSPMSGNGHNVSFDGRLFVTARGDGWNLLVLRPERVGTAPGIAGEIADVSAAFSEPVLIQPEEQCENALALCEANADDTPYACDEAGARGGPFACYELRVFDSNACGGVENRLRFRDLKLWIADPGTAEARYEKHVWTGARTALTTTTFGSLRGIEPTVTRDGKLLVWQGHPQNNGDIDVLMYATNEVACGASNWRGPFHLSHLVNDAVVNTHYRLAERTLRAADGTPFVEGSFVRGAYPWIFPDGSAINFTSVTVPCRAENDPAGCGPRRGGFAVMGYPTNWGLAHVDGPVNPDTDQTVRLFFSSPGPHTFGTLPRTQALDVWPFFGSNTSNYTEIVFDDGLDGNYAGVWLMNESVNKDGNLDRARTPDTSGYFNTGLVENAIFPLRNEGPRGKTLAFNGTTSRVRVRDDVSLDPVNGITVEMTLRPDAPVDCDENNNWRVLVDKGGVGAGAYSLVFEEGETLQARVRAGGEQRSVWAGVSIPVGQWSDIAFSYQASTGRMSFFVNGVETGAAQYEPAPLDGADADVFFGGPGGARPACPDGNGGFLGQIEEVRISRVDRFHADPGPGEGEGEPGEGEGEGEGEGGEGEGEGGGEGGEGEGEGDGVPLGPGRGPDVESPPPDGCAALPSAPGVALGLLALLRRRPRRFAGGAG
jgi:hypothetical protein